MLVDSTQGIQAQTLANYRMVKKAELDVIPVLTKLVVQHANPENVKEQMYYVMDIDPDLVIENEFALRITRLPARMIRHFHPVWTLWIFSLQMPGGNQDRNQRKQDRHKVRHTLRLNQWRD